ncbi:MAG: response regulator transcription factor [Candidatus Nanopelagicales bacterium]
MDDQLTVAVRVVLVDDESLVRMGLKLILEGDPSIEIVDQAADGLAAIASVQATHPDVILMDVRMPHLDGLSATERILADQPDAKIIVLTTFDTDEFILCALRLGASGFLLKDTPPPALIDAVRKVAVGETILSPSVLRQLIATATDRPSTELRTNAQHRLDQLTERERDIANAIALGHSNAQIAAELFISITTVKSHIGRILDKLAVTNRVQIAICVHNATN